MLSGLELLQIALVVTYAVVLTFIICIQQVQIRRYERFRAETGAAVGELAEGLADLNQRLTAAGYPPGRVVPNTTYPARTPQLARTVERFPL